MNEERRELALRLRVGVFVLVALAALLGLIYALGARAHLFEPRYTIHAEFTEVGGLLPGATVRLAGVQIGRVSDVHLPAKPGGKVRVDLTIGKQFADRIRGDSAARIETQGLLGDKLVEITVGSAAARAVAAGETIEARDPLDVGDVISEAAETVNNVAALTKALKKTAEAFSETPIVDDVAAVAGSARRASEQIEGILAEVRQGRGWAHALLYEEPTALRRLNALVTSAHAVLDRVERGEGAVGVLTSRESSEAARRFVAAMNRLSALAERSADADGLLPAVLFDPKYRGVLDDLQAVTRNLREVSVRVAGTEGLVTGAEGLVADLRLAAKNLREVTDRVAGGEGTLGRLVADDPDVGLAAAMRDLRIAVANLRAITEKINEGEGTLGALLADPGVYERLVTILDGAQRSFLLRSLIRGLGKERPE